MHISFIVHPYPLVESYEYKYSPRID